MTPELPPVDSPELPSGDALLYRLMAASHRESVGLRRRLAQSGEFEVVQPLAQRAD
jgi:hypothetical protein